MFEALDNPVFLVMFIMANALALILLLAAWKWVRAARWMFVLLLAWASWTNASTALNDPEAYLEYADLTWSKTYSDIILGPFAEHITRYVGMVAVCQALIALSLLLKGFILRVGSLGGIVFLLAIVPFGVGSGFPCTLVMAVALFMVMRKEARHWPWPAERLLPVPAVVEQESSEG
ncbi:MAG: hypothetical protein IT229_06205 [Flavobacteriales bacterium]|nr:hypothetical protein [Flavobacteriales bacterium]